MRVSVCIPSFNGEDFVEQALRSVLNQGYRDFELVVSDDASSDGTVEIVRSTRDDRLRFNQNPQRLGLVGNWNRCLELAQGEYVIIFHQDDLMIDGALSRLVRALDSNLDAGFAFGNVLIIDREENVIAGHWYPGLPTFDTVYKSMDFLSMMASNGNVVPCQTVMARASRLREIGGFDASLGYTPDLEMWLRLAARSPVAFVAEPVVRIRRHSGQESTRFFGRMAELDEVCRAYRLFLEKDSAIISQPERLVGLSSRFLASWSRNLSWKHARRLSLLTSLAFLRKSIGFALRAGM